MNKIMETRLKLRSELEAPPWMRQVGSGWISGVGGLILGVAGLLLVISLRAPGAFSVPQLHAIHSDPWFRLGLQGVLLLAFAMSVLSLVLRPNRILGMSGLGATLLAVLIGAAVPSWEVKDLTPLYFGLDWFVLSVLFTGFLFVPLERIFTQNDQSIFRDEWREDLFYYLISTMMVQILTFLTFLPAKSLLAILPLAGVRAWVGALPFAVQFIAIMALTDFVQYWVHRAFHRVPFLWKFHAVHHSAKGMDWIAGARMHFLEVLALRSTTVLPMYLLGFEQSAVTTYIFVVYFYSTIVHANVNWQFPIVERLLVTPRFHHWHHGIEQEAIDVNFAIHFPIYDKLFGTYFLPSGRWPSGYGVQGHPVPSGYIAQFEYPFRRENAAS